MDQSESKLIFEIEGIPRREWLKKHRSYVAVYDDHVYVELDGDEDYIKIDDIFDVYVQEPIVGDVTSRTTVIEFFQDGEQNSYDLEDETFTRLAEKIERVLQNEWIRFIKTREYPNTIKWFIACLTVVNISSGKNPYIYGTACNLPEVAADQRKVLYESWGFNKKEDLLAMLPKLLDGRAMNDYLEDLENIDDLDEDESESVEIIRKSCGENGIWAWDLQRVILLCDLGYVSNYLSYEESLEWALKAAKKLQSIYKSWDEFMQSYLLGYCYWSGDDLDDEDSEAYERAQVYKFYKNRQDSPWNIDWNHPLSHES